MQIAEGDPRKRGVHKLEDALAGEPQAQRGLPRCPAHLNPRARAAWNFWSRELESMGLDHLPDAMMLQGACVNYSRAVEADLIVKKDGLIVEESTLDKETGEKIVLRRRTHPALGISRTCWMLTHKFCSEFGLSPVSRTRLKVEKRDDGVQDLAALLATPRPRKTTETDITTVN